MVGASLLSLVGVIVSGGKRAEPGSRSSWAGTTRGSVPYARPHKSDALLAGGRESAAPSAEPVKAAYLITGRKQGT